jgi:integrase
MASPWKHPTTGYYYFRKVVPTALREAVGLVEIRRSLDTKDPTLAKELHSIVALEVSAEWRRLRGMVASRPGEPEIVLLSLSQKEAHALAGEFYREFVAAHEEAPGAARDWVVQLMSLDACLPIGKRSFESTPKPWNYGMMPELTAMRQFGGQVQEFLTRRGMALDTKSFRMVCSAFALAMRDAAARLKANAEGDYSPDRAAERFPPIETVLVRAQLITSPRIGAEELLDRWIAHTPASVSTRQSWSGKLRNLARFVGKDDMAAITQDDVAAWRDHRKAQGISARTISEGDLAGTHAIFAWAVGEVTLPSFKVNPVSGVTMQYKAPPKTRESGFTFEEAELVLRASLEPAVGFTKAGAGARRWVPWLCAFSGARVGEIAQVHSRNVFQKKSRSKLVVWCLRITPDDGPIKDNEARIIPLHPQIIEQGFLDYVASRRGKPLFYEPELGRKEGTHHRQSDKVGERLAVWVRKLGIPKPVQPNHAWRHRFESTGRHLALRTDIVDHITGHAPGNVAANYGDYLIDALYKAVCLFPPYLTDRDEEETHATEFTAGGLSILAGPNR